MYVYVYRANTVNELIPVTLDMLNIDTKAIAENIKNNDMTYDVTITIDNINNTFNVVFILEDSLEQMAENCTADIMKNNSTEDEFATMVGSDIEGFYIKFTYNGYSYYLPVSQDMMIDAEQNVITSEVKGAYKVVIMGKKFTFVVYDMEDAQLSAYLYDDIKVTTTTTEEEIINQLIGKRISISYRFSYVTEDGPYSYYYRVRVPLTRDMIIKIGDTSQFGMSTITVMYEQSQMDISIEVDPYLGDEEPEIYELIRDGYTQKVKVYKDYCYTYTYYKFELVDAEHNIYKLSRALYSEKYYIVDTDKKLMKEFTASEISDTDPVIYTGVRGGEYYEIRCYDNKFADIYCIREDEDPYLDTTTLVSFIEDGDDRYIVIEDSKYLIGENNVLTIPITGEILYTYEMQEGEESYIKFEFRDDNGQKTGYYYSKQKVDDEYSVEVIFDWTINEEKTLITCTYMGMNVFDFVVENGQIINVISKMG